MDDKRAGVRKVCARGAIHRRGFPLLSHCIRYGWKAPSENQNENGLLENPFSETIENSPSLIGDVLAWLCLCVISAICGSSRGFVRRRKAPGRSIRKIRGVG